MENTNLTAQQIHDFVKITLSNADKNLEFQSCVTHTIKDKFLNFSRKIWVLEGKKVYKSA